MAKLGAYGRTEICRAQIERVIENDSLINWERITRALMSDGKVLVKRDVRFKDSLYGDYKHSYGWKVIGKVRSEFTNRESVVSLWQKHGYTIL